MRLKPNNPQYSYLIVRSQNIMTGGAHPGALYRYINSKGTTPGKVEFAYLMFDGRIRWARTVFPGQVLEQGHAITAEQARELYPKFASKII